MVVYAYHWKYVIVKVVVVSELLLTENMYYVAYAFLQCFTMFAIIHLTQISLTVINDWLYLISII